MGKIEEEEGEEGNDHGKTNKVHFHEDGSEVREISRAGSFDSSSSSSSGTMDSNVDDSLSETTPIPHDHKDEIAAPVPTRIPPISPSSPPVVLERQAVYDPNRIPPTIFTTRPSNPADWSVASNESLFSIQMGNNSFSKEHTAFLLYKSGELTKLDEVFSVPTPLPPVSESMSLQRDSVSSSLAANSLKLPSTEDDPVDISKCEPSNVGSGPALETGKARNSVSLSARSDGSLATASTGSFAFPILAGSGRKSASVVTSDGERMESSKEQQPGRQQQNHRRTTVRAALSNCFSCCTFRWSFLLRR